MADYGVNMVLYVLVGSTHRISASGCKTATEILPSWTEAAPDGIAR